MYGKILASAALAVTSMMSVTHAQEIELSRSGDSDGRTLVDRLYSDEISRNVGVNLATAVIDLQGDGVGEVLARFESRNTCQRDKCETVIAYYDEERGGWREVFRDRVENLSLGEVGTDGFRSLHDGGDTAWSWNGSRYESDLSLTVELLKFDEIQSGPAFEAVRRDAESYFVASEESDRPLSVAAARADVNGDGSDETFVMLQGGAACGALLGCPVLAYSSFDEGPFFRGSSNESVFLTHDRKGDLRGIGLTNSRGRDVRYWNGNDWVSE